MSPSPFLLLPLGLVLGFVMGLTGATAAVLVPTFVLACGLSQAQAQGTSVTLTLSPAQLPAIWTYHRAGNVDWRLIGWLLPGVLVGSLIGARVANVIPPVALRSIFGAMLVLVGACAMLSLTTPSVGKAIALALIVTAFAGAIVAASRWHETRTMQQ